MFLEIYADILVVLNKIFCVLVPFLKVPQKLLKVVGSYSKNFFLTYFFLVRISSFAAVASPPLFQSLLILVNYIFGLSQNTELMFTKNEVTSKNLNFGNSEKKLEFFFKIFISYSNNDICSEMIYAFCGSTALDLSCNQLTGSIPTEIGFLKKLSILALEHNMLTGEIPSNLGIQGMLKRLYLGFNQLSGPIPLKLATAPQLEVLEVQNNTLSGIVPPG